MANFIQTFTSLFRSFSSRKKTVALSEETAKDDLNPITTFTQPSPPPKTKKITKTISGSAKLLLDLLGCVSDDVPWTGFGALVGGLRILFEQYEKVDENNADIEELHQNLERLREHLEPFTDSIPTRLNEFLTTHLAPPLVSIDGRDIATVTNDIKAKTTNFEKSSTLRKFFSASQDAKDIADLAKTVNNILTDITMQLQRTTLKIVIESKTKTDTILPHVAAARQQLVREALIKAQNALPDAFGRKPCLEGTRLDVLNSIEDWVRVGETSPQVFCLSGESGSGKTTIAVTICQELSVKFRVAGFFCSSTFDDASNPKYIFPTLAGQLGSREDAIYSVLEPLLREHDPTHGCGQTQFEKLLIESLDVVDGTTLLVIDGLDECKSSHEVSEVLNTLFGNIRRLPSLKVLLCCRSNSPIMERDIPKISGKSLAYRLYSLDDVSALVLRHDLRRLLVVELKRRGFEQKNITSLCDVINNVHCSFFVALTACEEISPSLELLKQVKVFSCLLSRGMNNIYESLIQRAFLGVGHGGGLGGSVLKSLHAALVLVAFGKNSLGLNGLSELLNVPIDQLLCFFSGFPDNILRVDNERVLIHHSSFQDYLESGQTTKIDGSSLQDCVHFDIIHHLFRRMDAYLRRHISGAGDFQSHVLVSNTPRRDVRNDTDNKALVYACRYWPEHLAKIDMTDEKTLPLFSILHNFFHRHLLHWLEVLAASGGIECTISVLENLMMWIEGHCDSTLEEHLLLKRIVYDASTSFKLFQTAIQSSPHQVYHSLILPWTPSGRRLADLYSHIEASIAIAEVSCHQRQLLSIEPGIGSVQEPLMIKLSQDASRVAVLRKDCIQIGGRGKDAFEKFLNDSDSQSYIDASFVGKDHILVTTISHSGYAEVQLWNVILKKTEKTLLQQYQASESKLLPVLALASENGNTPSMVALLTLSKVKVWEVQTWEEQLSIQYRTDQDPQKRLLALSSHHILVGLRLRRISQLGDRMKTMRLEFTETPRCATFSFDGDTLAIAGDTGISLYTHILGINASKISPTSVLSITRPVDSLVYSPAGRYLAATGESFLWAWDTSAVDQPLINLQNDGQRTVSSVVFSEDGRYLRCAHVCSGSKTALFDMRIMEEPISAQMPVTALAMSCNGKVATGSNNGAVTIWNSSMTKVLRYWKRERHHNAVASIIFSQDGKFIASASQERVYIRSTSSDLGSDEVAQRLPVQSFRDPSMHFLSPCTFSADASLFVCLIEAESRPTFVQIWKMASWKLLGEFELDSQDYASGEEIHSIALSQKGTLFAISGKKNSLAVYTLVYSGSSIHIKGTPRRCVTGRTPLCLAFNTDNKCILSTAGAFDIEHELQTVPEIPLANAFLQDGWIVDLDGRQRCWVPFVEDICDWASCRSMLVICTKTLGNVILVAVRSLR